MEQVIANLHEDMWEEGVGEVDQREVSVSHLAHCFAIFFLVSGWWNILEIINLVEQLTVSHPGIALAEGKTISNEAEGDNP